jgi:hypothetical protein
MDTVLEPEGSALSVSLTKVEELLVDQANVLETVELMWSGLSNYSSGLVNYVCSEGVWEQPMLQSLKLQYSLLKNHFSLLLL